MKNSKGIVGLVMVLFAVLACSDAELEKANLLVDEANKFITIGNENAEKADKKYIEYTEKVKAIETEDDLENARKFGKELFPLYDAMNENFKKAGEKFEEASKLKINNTFKEYLEAKGKEFKLRAEHALEMKKIPQALIDSKSKGRYEDENNKIIEKANKLWKEFKELDEKAEKIRKDNPTVFKN